LFVFANVTAGISISDAAKAIASGPLERVCVVFMIMYELKKQISGLLIACVGREHRTPIPLLTDERAKM
jgi:hypothetical protein